MLITASNVAAILILILPGFMAYRFVVLGRDTPNRVSPLWQLSEILEYSVYVHLIGAVLSFAVVFTIERGFGIATQAENLIKMAPSEFLKLHPWEAMLWLILYPIYVIVASTVLGAWDFPRLLRGGIYQCLMGITQWCRRVAWFRWIPLPSEQYAQEPAWVYAFRTRTNAYRDSIPLMIVTMKSGDVYFGRLVSYPIVPDTENEKDFLIDNARFYQQGNAEQEQDLSKLDGVGAVLLNTANVDSIRIYYQQRSEGSEA